MNFDNKTVRRIAAVAVIVLAVVVAVLFVTGRLGGNIAPNEPISDAGLSQSGISSEISPDSALPSESTAPESTAPESTAPESVTPEITTPESSSVEVTLRFRNNKLLQQHYEKHGRDMGFSSAEEYERAAAAVPFHPEVLHKTEAEDGDDVYYIESTNEFVIVSTDGYLRTYFNPDRGIDYYNKQ